MKRYELERDAILSRIGNIISGPTTKDGKAMNADAAIAAAKAGIGLTYNAAAVIISDDEVGVTKGVLIVGYNYSVFEMLSHKNKDKYQMTCFDASNAYRNTVCPMFLVRSCASFRCL